MTSKRIEGVFEIQFACGFFFKLVSGNKPGCRKQPQCYFWFHSCAHAHVKLNSLISVCSIFLSLLELNLNNQGFIYLECVKYQLHRNMPAFTKCNLCVSAIHIFFIYRHVQTFFPYQK